MKLLFTVILHSYSYRIVIQEICAIRIMSIHLVVTLLFGGNPTLYVHPSVKLFCVVYYIQLHNLITDTVLT
jgi:hypothetical protein